MVKQGDIIKISFDPTMGHEQRGWRPALVVSNDTFNTRTNMKIICPITNTKNQFPLHVPLDSRTKTTGVILCEHVQSVDVNARPHRVVEQIPSDLLENVLTIVRNEF
jgi:mRNA interferase MazF